MMYDQYLEKLAEKFISSGDNEDMFKAVRSQPRMRFVLRHLAKASKRPDQSPMKGTGHHLSRKKEMDDQVRSMAGQAAGTVHQDKKTGKRRVVLNRRFGSKLKGQPITRRQLIAHEAFHAKAPKLIRDSETLAHIYGGVKGTKGGFRKKVKAGAQQYNHYSATRGVRAKVVPVTGGAAIGGTVNAIRAKRHNRKIDKRRAAEGANFDATAKKNQKRKVLSSGAKGAVVGGAVGAALSNASAKAGLKRAMRKAKEAA